MWRSAAHGHAIVLCCVLQCREAIAVIQVKKYRQLKRAYEPASVEAESGSSSEARHTAAAGSNTSAS